MNFRELHKQDAPLLICNVWDVVSAQVAENLDFKAIGTSSSAVAAMLGYNDGEDIPFAELAYIADRICKSTSLPLTVDLEGGYSRIPSKIVDNIKHLAQLGVKGINLEDSVVSPQRNILPVDEFASSLEKICETLDRDNIDMYINVRTDPFLLGLANPVEITLERAKAYQNAGASGLFVPFIVNEEDIAKVLAETELPLNVMCMPNLPSFEVLKNLGVHRISMGSFLYGKLGRVLAQELMTVIETGSFENLFD